MSLDTMRGLKAKNDEDVRRFQVQTLVKLIYAQAVDKASTTTETSYMHHCGMYQTYYSSELYSKNTEEVLLALRDLFPGCRVSAKKFVAIQGKLVPYEHVQADYSCDHIAEHYIAVDWS
jgi:hypothetical protein